MYLTPSSSLSTLWPRRIYFCTCSSLGNSFPTGADPISHLNYNAFAHSPFPFRINHWTYHQRRFSVTAPVGLDGVISTTDQSMVIKYQVRHWWLLAESNPLERTNVLLLLDCSIPAPANKLGVIWYFKSPFYLSFVRYRNASNSHPRSYSEQQLVQRRFLLTFWFQSVLFYLV